MYGQLLQSAEILIEHLDFLHFERTETRFTEDQFDAFRIKFARYLRGTGHPSNLPENMVPLAMRDEIAEDKLYRARRFLKCSTGSSTIPTDPDWKITVRASLDL